MAHHHLLQRISLPKPVLLRPPSLQGSHLVKRYSKSNGSDDRVIGEKGWSTAEEFSRVAREKAESVSRTVKETMEGVKEESAKQKFKKAVEKGSYDNMGQKD